jgi:hypothetical protein
LSDPDTQFGLLKALLPSDAKVSGGRRRPALRHAVPYSIPKGMEVEERVWAPSQDGAPSLTALLGAYPGGEKLAVVLMDRPSSFRSRRAKQTMEEHHLERFIADYRRGAGESPFESHRRGADPPDFVVVADDRERGLEVTQFVFQEQVEAHAAFREIRSAVVARGPHRFRQLRGQIVYVGVGSRALGRVGDLADGIPDALERLNSQMGAGRLVTGADGPPPFEAFEGGVLMAGQLWQASGGSFYGLMGFELALCHPTAIYEEEAWRRLQALVAAHDKPGVEALLVAICAPVADGLAFHSDAVVAMLVERASQPLEAKHIELIFFHTWLTRRVELAVPGEVRWTTIAAGEHPWTEDLDGAEFWPAPDDWDERPEALWRDWPDVKWGQAAT